jgi:lipoyl(octanoyl) transferase
MKVRWLGRMAFADALALQEKLVAERRTNHSLGDELLLLEHDPVYTIGRTPDQTSLRGAAPLPYPHFTIKRGGQATYCLL